MSKQGTITVHPKHWRIFRSALGSLASDTHKPVANDVPLLVLDSAADESLFIFTSASGDETTRPMSDFVSSDNEKKL